MTTPQPKKVNYLNNKDILKQIHASKMSYCYVQDDKYFNIDLILDDVKKINKTAISEARANRASKVQSEGYQKAMAEGGWDKKPKQKDFAIEPESIPVDELVFRVMGYDHIPDEPGRKKTTKTIADTKAKLNFPPFKHYILDSAGSNPREVARSHWVGGLHNGHFSVDHGKITNTLGSMFMKLVERYSQRGNWRGYTYVDEMRGQALVQLAQIGLQFNEAKSDNPFAYYTATVNNSFTRVLNLEKRNQNIRDDILIESGHLPSYGRQIAHENAMKELRSAAETEVENTNTE
jgi:hypothetical protein